MAPLEFLESCLDLQTCLQGLWQLGHQGALRLSPGHLVVGIIVSTADNVIVGLKRVDLRLFGLVDTLQIIDVDLGFIAIRRLHITVDTYLSQRRVA